MAKKDKNLENGSARRQSFGMMVFTRLFGFGPKKELSFAEEEALQSPGRMVLQNFLHKRTAMFGLVVFLLIFAFVMIGPIFMPIDLGYADASQANIAPGLNMMKVPSELKKTGVADIAVGPNYSIGVDSEGEMYIWGYTRITDTIDMSDIPDEVQEADIVLIAAGTDHAVALAEDGELYFWGNDRLGQANYSSQRGLVSALAGGAENIKQLEASNQFSAIVTTDGELYLWGNDYNADIEFRSEEKLPEGSTATPKQYQGNVEKVALTDFAYIVLLKDGTVAYTGFSNDSPLRSIPTELTDGSVKVVDIAATAQNVAAVDENGKIYVWGNCTHGERNVPESESIPVELYGGRYHYTALMENGDVISWGDDTFHQAEVPDSVNEADVLTVYAGCYQNYAITTDGDVLTWGLKGYLMGTDDLGRDILSRIVNGGKMTMTVGAIAVIISTIIGVVLGGLAGYFGGAVDMVTSRIAEIVYGLPFLPFALILSTVIGTKISVENRMYIIMVVLGVLSWTSTFRLVRAQIFSQGGQEYVTAAKTMGVREGSIVMRHIIPNVMSVLLVSITLSFATCMLTESTLSYMGFGIPLPTPTWGNMLTGANNSIVIQQYWWRWVFTAGIFGLCTVCINLIGDGLRDAMDPKSAER